MTRRTSKDSHNPNITLGELRDLAAKKQPPEELEFGPPQFIYVELGRLPLTSALHVEARETVAGDELLFDVDRNGRIYGIEIGIAADNL